jgi:hypothetical protein
MPVLRSILPPIDLPSETVLERIGAVVDATGLVFGGPYISNIRSGGQSEINEYEKGTPRKNPFLFRIPPHDLVSFPLWRGYYSFWLAVSRRQDDHSRSAILIRFEDDPFAEEGPGWVYAFLSNIILEYACDYAAIEDEKRAAPSPAPSAAEVVAYLTTPEYAAAHRPLIVVLRAGLLDQPTRTQILKSGVAHVEMARGGDVFSWVSPTP